MNRGRIDQLVDGFAAGDAISHAARLMRDALRQEGWESDIFADPAHIAPDMRGACLPHGSFLSGESSRHAVFLHYSIQSRASDIFVGSQARRVLIYHNITPAHFFQGFDDAVASRLEHARTALPSLARRAHAVWADSKFNADELTARGVPSTVFALPWVPNPSPPPPDPHVSSMLAGPLPNILFVGRIAPNKRLEDLIRAFAWIVRSGHSFLRLVIAGSERSCPRYYTMLRMLAAELDMPNVCFTGFVSPAGLEACYGHARLFVCASAHEGYCLPLVEAVSHGVPVLARKTGGMPEALGGAGVLYDGLDAPRLGALMLKLVRDQTLRHAVLESQSRRWGVLQSRDIRTELRKLLDGAVAAGE